MRPAIRALSERLRSAGWGDRLQEQVLLAPYTTFRVGGAADLAVEARSDRELLELWQLAHDHGVPSLVLGRGSNVLIADRGVRGLVILNRCTGWELGSTGELRALSGTALTDLALATAAAGWSGLEWSVGIPGSVGGAIVGNAGAHGGYVSDVLEVVTVLDRGAVRKMGRLELELGYRTSVIKTMPNSNGRLVILDATFRLRPKDQAELELQLADWLEWRKDHHPHEPSAGSVFRRTAQYPAGFLVDQAGMKGKRIGDAQVSPKHANFIVNLGEATASDIRALVEEVRDEVAARFGTDLELEIELVGDW